MSAESLDRALARVRAATAGLALAAALFLLLHVPLLATFRGALVALAALEVLAFGRRALAASVPPAAWIEPAVKIAVLVLAYVAVSD